MPRNLNLRAVGKGADLYKLPSIVNEIAPLLVLSILAIENKGLGLTATRIHEEIKSLFLEEGDIELPPSFLYPLMQGLVEAKLIHKDKLRYFLNAKYHSKILAELEGLTALCDKLKSHVKRAHGLLSSEPMRKRT